VRDGRVRVDGATARFRLRPRARRRRRAAECVRRSTARSTAREHVRRVLGKFRNTYYDFPNESDFAGVQVPLKNARCDTISSVAKGFFEAVCVQGSGTLRRGSTVSFAKRDCSCAELCPRTEQRICFDELDAKEYPWGRGATGKPITPLLTVAVDPEVITLGTAVYVPELDGLPRDPDGISRHDGCFVAQDKGLKVKGQHLDIFTGHSSMTALWNRMVPSNRGVTVVVETQRCARGAP
jgi:3D (Asp-Asp-Asp) domain-containing protein